jgi:hypothetical protein
MSTATVRANARALPEAERAQQPAQTAEELQALASDFEAAFQAQRLSFMAPAVTRKLTPRPRASMRSRAR